MYHTEMITQDKRVFTEKETEALIGDYLGDALYFPITGTVEKAPPHISKYIVETSSELKIYKREKGIQIQIRYLLNDKVNFILQDDQISEVVWHENQSERHTPKLSIILVVLSIFFTFLLDGLINNNKLLYLPLLFGLILGLILSLFFPNSRKKTITLLATVNGEHEILILSDVMYSKFKAFFEHYYPEKSSRN